MNEGDYLDIAEVIPNTELGCGKVTSIGGATDVVDEAVWDVAGDFRLRDEEARTVSWGTASKRCANW